MVHAITPWTYRTIVYRGRSFFILARESCFRHYCREGGPMSGPLLSLPDTLIRWVIEDNSHADTAGCTPWNHDSGGFVSRWW